MACRELGLLAVLCLVSGCSNRDTIQLSAVIESLDPAPVSIAPPKPVPKRVALVETKSKRPEKVTPADVYATRGKYKILAPSATVASIVVTISEQKLSAFDQIGSLVFWEQVSTALGGKTLAVDAPRKEHKKPHNHLGEFKVIDKDEDHISKEYGCPMPYSVFFTPGHAIHQTERKFYRLLGTPASHGCIREGPVAAKWLFDHTPIGCQVVIVESLTPVLPPQIGDGAGLVKKVEPDAGMHQPQQSVKTDHTSASLQRLR